MSTTCYKFGGVEVRPAERQIVVAGQPASVGARAFDVLMALIDRRDRVVTKDELLDIVWPGLVVEENNLQVQVSTLRKVLGARSVATIPGRGYRFTLTPETADAAMSDVSAPRHNLPAQLNRFIGREHEIGEVKGMLAQSRLVTLTSLGGTGKTRLSIQVGHELVNQFPDGVWFVELAPVANEAGVSQAVASTLGVQEQHGASTMEGIARWARNRNFLLIVDNCEHVLRCAAEVVKCVLQAAPSAHVLASSREPLRLSGEAVLPLSPLPTPDARYATSASILEQYDSVRLFADRAAAANSAFRLTEANIGAIASICQRLDGIPLAIELAAARVRALSVENIAARLDDCFRLLTGGDQTVSLRQQTLRASLDWSHDLLTTEEAILFRRLAVFAGGWTLEAAERVCGDSAVPPREILDVLTRLVEKSLVEIDAYGERYGLLATVLQYAQERLYGCGEAHGMQQRHLDYYVELAIEARPHLLGPDQAIWLKRLDDELENILAAHSRSEGEPGLRLVSSIKHYCLNRGLIALANRLASEALDRAPEASAARCQSLLDAGQTGLYLGRHEEARLHLEESLAIAKSLGDDRRVAIVLQPLGVVCLSQGDTPAARMHLQSGLAMALERGEDREIAAALNALGHVHRVDGDTEAAAKLYQEAIAYARRLGDRESIALGLINLAMASASSPHERAALVLEAIELGEAVGSKYVGQSALDVCAGLCAAARDWSACARHYGAAQAQIDRTGVRRDVADEAFLAPRVSEARSALGEREFDAAVCAGRGLSYPESVSEARAYLARIVTGKSQDRNRS